MQTITLYRYLEDIVDSLGDSDNLDETTESKACLGEDILYDLYKYLEEGHWFIQTAGALSISYRESVQGVFTIGMCGSTCIIRRDGRPLVRRSNISLYQAINLVDRAIKEVS